MSAKPYTRSASATIDPEATTPPESAAAGPTSGVLAGVARARLAILGVNAWIVALLVPSLHLGGLDRLVDLLVSSAPLLVLAVGLAIPSVAPLRDGIPTPANGSRSRPTVTSLRSLIPHRAGARWVLLAGYPTAIAAALGLRPELAERDAHGTIGLVLAALSLVAFVAAAAHASSHQPGGADMQTPLERDPVAEPIARRWVRRSLLAVAAAGALALTLIAPTLGGRRARVERWGEAADDATVLAAVVAATVACVAVGAIVGPALRAARPGSNPPAQRQRRLAASMLLAVAAGVGWLVLRHFDSVAGG